MHVGAETRIVGQVPAWIVRIGVEDDIVATPVPVGAIVEIGWGHREVEVVKKEAVSRSAAQAVYVACADLAGEAAMLPRIIEVICLSTAVVADPAIGLGVHVRSGRVARLIWCTCVALAALAAAILRALWRRAATLRLGGRLL